MSMIFTFGDMRFSVQTEWVRLPASMPTLPIAGIACDASDRLTLLTRNHEHPIVQLDEEGKYIRTLGADLRFGNEHGIFISEQGHIWVCDSARHVVYELDENGELLRTLGNLDKPCDNGFRPEIPYPHNLYTITRGGEPFNLPTGAVQAPDGSIYCCDGYGNTAVHHFSAEGELLRTWGEPGDKPGQFRLPHSLWVDPQQRVWVADRDNFRVQVFGADGALLRCYDPVYPKDSPYGASWLWGDARHMYCGQNSLGILVFDIQSLDYLGAIEAPTGNPILGHSLCGDSLSNLYIGHLGGSPMVARMTRL